MICESLERRYALASIQGFVWHDLNQDSVFDIGEPVLSGRSVYLDQNNNGSLDGTEVSTLSLANGSYLFQGLAAGTYRVAVVGQSNWIQTTPRAATITAETASAPMWRSLGPSGADIVGIASSPLNANRVLAASNTGAYVSDNAGANWSELPYFQGRQINSVAFASNGDMYVGGFDGLFKSSDSGQSWLELKANGNTFNLLNTIAAHPTDANVLIIGKGPRLLNDTIWKSIDAGATWTNVSPVLPQNRTPSTIRFNANDPNEVFVAYGKDFGPYGVFRSGNGGLSWMDQSSGLPPGPANDVFLSGANVYVAIGQGVNSGLDAGVYKSTDHGLTWIFLSSSWALKDAQSIAVDPTNPSVIVAGTLRDGVYRSTDGGASWSFTSNGTKRTKIPDIEFIAGKVFAGASALGVVRSSDSGASFVSSQGFVGFDVYSMAVNPLNPMELALVYQSQEIGSVSLIMTSLDGGKTWSIADAPLDTVWSKVAFSPSGVLYAIGGGSTAVPDGLAKRNANGTWSAIGPSFFPGYDVEAKSILFHPTNANVIVVAGNTAGEVLPSTDAYRGAIWRTTNGGLNWTRTWLAAASLNGVFTSVLDVEQSPDGLTMIARLVDRTNQLGNEGTVVRSSNGGITWQSAINGITGIPQSYAIAAANVNGKFYLGTQSNKLYVTTNGGSLWTQVLTSNYSGSFNDLLVDPNDSRIIYTNGFRSLDSGLTFTRFSDGADTAYFKQLVYSGGTSPKLYTATSSGIFVTELYTTKMQSQSVTVTSAQTVSNINFGQRARWSTISGLVWEDANGDGIFAGEFGRSNWTVYIDANNNNILDPGEAFQRTRADGSYPLSGLESGTYRIKLQQISRWNQTFPATNAGYVLAIGVGVELVNKDFGVQSDPTQIRGKKWKDLNGNGIQDTGEPGLPGWRIYFDYNANGQYDFSNESQTSVLTDSLGNYTIPVNNPDTFLIGEVPPDSSWIQTFPADGKSKYDAGFGFTNIQPRPKWADHDLTTPNVIDIWYDFRDLSGFQNLITPGQRIAVRAALNRWELETAGRIRFSLNTVAAASDIIIIGTGDLAAVGFVSEPFAVLGVGGNNVTGNDFSSGFVWMDSAETWDEDLVNDPLFTIDYYTIAGHEVGHAIGMAHAENLPFAWKVLMDPGYSGSVTAYSTVDRDQVRSLYGVPNQSGLGFHVIHLERGETRNGVNFGSGQSSAPTNIVLSNASVNEKLPAGQAIGTLTATDADPSDSHQFTLVAGTGSDGNSAFTIVGNQLKATSTLDFETRSSYSIRVRATDLFGLAFEKVFTVNVLNVAPRVGGIYVRGSSWSQAYLNTLASAGVGSASLGFRLVDGLNQLANSSTLAWQTIDSISAIFDEPVIMTASSMRLINANNVNIPYSPSGFSYDNATSTATWGFAPKLSLSKYLMSLDDVKIADGAGAILDGEWTTSVSTYSTSGNGIAGGDLNFRFNVLPGDVTRNGQTNPGDVNLIRSLGTLVPDSTNYWRDVTGNNQINPGDANFIATLGTLSLSGLPDPTPPPAGRGSLFLRSQVTKTGRANDLVFASPTMLSQTLAAPPSIDTSVEDSTAIDVDGVGTDPSMLASKLLSKLLSSAKKTKTWDMKLIRSMHSNIFDLL